MAGVQCQNRYKMVLVDANRVLGLFTASKCSTFEFAKFVGLPKDVKVVGVQYDFALDVFRLRLFHPSFDIVEMGSEPPTVYPEFKVVSIKEVKDLQEIINGALSKIEDFKRLWHSDCEAKGETVHIFLRHLVTIKQTLEGKK